MKNPTFFILLSFLFLLSCNKKSDFKDNKIEENIVYNIDDYVQSKNKNVKIIDTACINEEKRAISDIKKGNLVFYNFPPMMKVYRSENELKKILSKYKIRLELGNSSCIPYPKGFRDNCYAAIMKTEIIRKYGNTFIDSIKNCAERDYISNNPEMIYEYEECDPVSRYPNTKNYSDFFDKPTRDFNDEVKYPKDYDHSVEELFSITRVDFILTKTGNVKDVIAESSFINPKNNKFISYFQDKAVEFVKKTKWIPSQKEGININSKMRIIIEHK